MGLLDGVATIGSHTNALNAWANLSINPSANIFLSADAGNVGIGTYSPAVQLHTTAGVRFANYASGANGAILRTNTAGDLAITNFTGNASDVLRGDGTFGALPAVGWSLTGNAATNPATNFIGTTDDISFNIRMNNQMAGRIGSTSDRSTFFGYLAGANDDASFNLNTFVGYQTGFSNTSGAGNTTIGANALYANSTGNENTALGYFSLFSNTSGNYNTAVGGFALRHNNVGFSNTALGYYAGFGFGAVNFEQCIFLGAYSYPTVAHTNVTMLGYAIADGQNTGDNQVLLGNTSVTQIRAAVTGITAYSDKRFKSNISEDVKGLDFILRLRPVSYNENPEILHQIWGTPDSLVKKIDHSQIKNMRFTGLLAQEVHEAMKESGYTSFTGIDIPRNEKEVYSLRYVDFVMPMIKAIQEQQKMIENLKQENEKLKAKNEVLESKLSEIEKMKAEIEAIKAQMLLDKPQEANAKRK